MWEIVCPYNKYLLRQILADRSRAEFKQDYVLCSHPAPVWPQEPELMSGENKMEIKFLDISWIFIIELLLYHLYSKDIWLFSMFSHLHLLLSSNEKFNIDVSYVIWWCLFIITSYVVATINGSGFWANIHQLYGNSGDSCSKIAISVGMSCPENVNIVCRKQFNLWFDF